jgi:chemotaxis protein methyltransferase CheR
VSLARVTPVIQPENYRFLQEYVRRESGIVLDDGKHYLIEARLLPIAMEEGLSSLDDLCRHLRLQSSNPLQKRVIAAMTTNETYFFREPAHFETLTRKILPALVRDRSDSKRISIWSAASSTGQEAYSLAIVLAEMGLSGWRIDLLGTDLSETVLARARAAQYSQLEVNRGLPVTMLVKYFTRDGAIWELKPELRRMAQFQMLDLRMTDSTIGSFDIVFCRNVLIYFDMETKRQIVSRIRSVMQPGGYLFLGATEVSIPVGPGFTRVTAQEAMFYQAV